MNAPIQKQETIGHFDQATCHLHVTKCAHFLRFTNLAFFQEFFLGCLLLCQFSCYANFSIVFGPNFGGGKVSEGGKLPHGGEPPPPVEESQLTAVM